MLSSRAPVVVAAPVLSTQLYRVFTGSVSSRHRGAGGATPSTSLRRSSQPAAAICAYQDDIPRVPTSPRMTRVPARPQGLHSSSLCWVSCGEQGRVNSGERQGATQHHPPQTGRVPEITGHVRRNAQPALPLRSRCPTPGLSCDAARRRSPWRGRARRPVSASPGWGMAAVIRIDAVWLVIEPVDMRAGPDWRTCGACGSCSTSTGATKHSHRW